ncbi:MAG: hypothetical protein ACE366_21795 [Bradymonadia bacterium]
MSKYALSLLVLALVGCASKPNNKENLQAICSVPEYQQLLTVEVTQRAEVAKKMMKHIEEIGTRGGKAGQLAEGMARLGSQVEPDPAQRYASVKAFCDDAEEALSSEGLKMPDCGPVADACKPLKHIKQPPKPLAPQQ